jgi:hypothetical protein
MTKLAEIPINYHHDSGVIALYTGEPPMNDELYKLYVLLKDNRFRVRREFCADDNPNEKSDTLVVTINHLHLLSGAKVQHYKINYYHNFYIIRDGIGEIFRTQFPKNVVKHLNDLMKYSIETPTQNLHDEDHQNAASITPRR